MPEHRGGLDTFAAALNAADPEGAVRAMVAALRGGSTSFDVERTLLRAITAEGDDLHAIVYASAAFDIAAGLGPDVGRYALAAAAMQAARKPKARKVEAHVKALQQELHRSRTAKGLGAVEALLMKSLDEAEEIKAVRYALELHRMSGEGAYPVEVIARWAAKADQVVAKPQGYVTHFPLLIDAALNMLARAATADDIDMLLAHLVHGTVDLRSRYEMEPVKEAQWPKVAGAEALEALPAAVHGRNVGALQGLIENAASHRRSLDEVARILMRCALEAKEGMSHRFTLAGAAWRTARRVPPALGRAVLLHAALSITHGYDGPRKLLELRDLPHPNPGGSDYHGRLLVGLASGNVAEAHAALRGLFEAGTSPRTATLPFMDAASQLDASELHTDHALIVTQAAWRAVSDGAFAGDALPLLAELATRIARAPKDHEIIALVEEASAGQARASA